MDQPGNSGRAARRMGFRALYGYRYHVLTWAGVVGTALTLLAGIEGLLDAVQLLAAWARRGIEFWKLVTRTLWSLLLGWLGIAIGPSLAALLNFALFGVLLALGVRLRVRSQPGEEQVTADAGGGTSAARIAAAFVAMPVLYLVLLLMAQLVAFRYLGESWIGDYPTAVFFALPLVIMAATFAWTHRCSRHALLLFPVALAYALSAYIFPLLSSTKEKWKPVLEALVSEPPWVAGIVGRQLTGAVENSTAFLSLAFINLIVSTMLAIAPPLALRKRLLASLAIAVGLVAVNLLLVTAEAMPSCIATGSHSCGGLRWRLRSWL